MSGIVVVLPHDGASPPEAAVRASLSRMPARGTRHSLRRGDGVVLAGCAHPWEPDPVSGDADADPGVPLVAADAALYHLPDLDARLGGARPPAASRGAASRIAAAQARWREATPEHLEGDFAYAAWHPDTRTLVCARDAVGRRPLFFARHRDALIVASSIGAILAWPGIPTELDLGSVAAAAAGLFAAHTETAYRAISRVPPGHTLVARAGAVRLLRHWAPPPVEDRPCVPGADLREGSERLRALLVDAVRERLDSERPTAVWLSGGWDSTAVFGAGMAGAGPAAARHDLRPVSVRYPPDDPGYEDPYIEAVARFWDVPVRWIESGQIPFFERLVDRAAERDEPFAHAYETWNRALAAGSRDVGANIALDGVGGDQLFQLSFVNLADLLRRGRWNALATEWRAKGLRGRRAFWHWAVAPLLPDTARRAIGRRIGPDMGRFYLERPIAPWVRREFLEAHGVLEREARNTPSRRGHSPVAYETHWYLAHPYGGQVLSCVSGISLEARVEVRSPLLDRRVIEFACSRPWMERSWGAETKRLLRAAVAGLIPDEVLAPRPQRTGLTSGFFDRGFRKLSPDLAVSAFRHPVLESAGMVDANRLWRGWERYLRSGDEALGIGLHFTLQTELWLRTRLG
jgi:asparagine synthase (glutamine-hydrolysing)